MGYRFKLVSWHTILDVQINFLRTYLNVRMFVLSAFTIFSIIYLFLIILFIYAFKNVHFCSFTFIFVQLRSYNQWTFMKIFLQNVLKRCKKLMWMSKIVCHRQHVIANKGYENSLSRIEIEDTVKVSFLARDHERTVPMHITDICQNDRNEKLYKKKIHACLITRQERNFHCSDAKKLLKKLPILTGS